MNWMERLWYFLLRIDPAVHDEPDQRTEIDKLWDEHMRF